MSCPLETWCRFCRNGKPGTCRFTWFMPDKKFCLPASARSLTLRCVTWRRLGRRSGNYLYQNQFWRDLTLAIEPPTFSSVKGLLAILFSVVLIVSQAASINAPVDLGNNQQASAAKCCGHCGPCKSKACCLGNHSSNSEQP